MYKEKREELVKNLEQIGYIKSKKVKQAFLQVPREEFVPEFLKNSAYVDSPLEIGSGQTISAPHMIAIMCEKLDLDNGHKVLEVGTGSGYHASIISKIIGNSGKVFTIERHENLAEKARENIRNAAVDNVKVVVGDGSEGLVEFQPYDRIYVTCAAPEIPKPLINQLNDPGILLVPVGGTLCELRRFEKNNGETSTVDLGGCAFVPLIGKYGH